MEKKPRYHNMSKEKKKKILKEDHKNYREAKTYTSQMPICQ